MNNKKLWRARRKTCKEDEKIVLFMLWKMVSKLHLVQSIQNPLGSHALLDKVAQVGAVSIVENKDRVLTVKREFILESEQQACVK